MNIDELEEKMIKAIKDMPEREELYQQEQLVLNDAECQRLILDFQSALDQYNFALKTFNEQHQITKDAQKKLYEAKLKMDTFAPIAKYNELLIKCNEPLRYIENNLFGLFKNHGERKCSE